MSKITNEDILKEISSATRGIEEKVGSVSEDIVVLRCKVDNLHKRQDKMDTTLDRLTDIVEIHEQRSTTLEKQVMPLFEEHQKQQIIDEHFNKLKLKKQERRREVLDKLKWPSVILGVITTISTVMGYLHNWFK